MKSRERISKSLKKNDIFNLFNLEVEEVSLVDAGANPEAHIVLYKRGKPDVDKIEGNPLKKEVDKTVDIKELIKQITEVVSKTVEEKMETVSERLEKVEKSQETKVENREEEKPKEAAVVEKKEETSDLVKKLQAEIEVLKEMNQESLEKNKEAELKQKLEKEYAFLPGTEDEKLELLKSVGNNTKVLELMKQLNKTREDSTEELGSSVSKDKGTAEVDADEITKKAQELVKSSKDMSFEEAYANILESEEGKELYKSQMSQAILDKLGLK